MAEYERIKTEVLVIGGGGAGVRAAIEADNQGADVRLVSKGPISKSGLTPMAYPSYQAAFGYSDSRDNADVHYQDIIKYGRNLSDQKLARALADESVPRVLDLEKYGVKFKMENDKFLQVHHPGQSYARNLFIMAAGYGLIAGLKRELSRHPKVRVIEDLCISRLLKDAGEVVGGVGFNLRDGRFYAVEAKSVILACGGYEELWGNTDTAPDSTGDGVSLGFEAGADIIDLEMALYYPTVFAHPESVKGVLVQYETFLEKDYLDFKLTNSKGKEFLPEGPLPVRDVLMRAIFTEIEEGRGTEHNAVYITPKGSSKGAKEIEDLINKLLKGPDGNLKSLGIDMRKDPLEIVPAVHYTLGGVHINEKGESSIPGLFAAGENASNVHGANRISGNALAETQVFGARAGRFASERAKKISSRTLPESDVKAEIDYWHSFIQKKKEGVRPHVLRKTMKQAMDRYMGPNRREEGMKKGLEIILDLKRNGLPKLQAGEGQFFNTDWRSAVEITKSVHLAELVIRSALHRKETRGHHFRPDYPQTAEIPQHTLIVRKGDQIDVTDRAVKKLDS
jgi:fumarate reductase (CoM/CoB) subunit A